MDSTTILKALAQHVVCTSIAIMVCECGQAERFTAAEPPDMCVCITALGDTPENDSIRNRTHPHSEDHAYC